MATLVKIPARHFVFEIDGNYGTSGGEDWIPIKGLTSLGMSPTTVDTPTTDFDSDGVAEHQTMERSSEFTASGFYLEDLTTGERDPGQEAVEDLGERMGPASVGSFRMTSPGGNRWKFLATVEVTSPGGGGNNDMSAWNAKFSKTGATTKELVTS